MTRLATVREAAERRRPRQVQCRTNRTSNTSKDWTGTPGPAALAALAVGCALLSPANAQAPSPVDTPLTLGRPDKSPYQLDIRVGVNGGASQGYLFDTGSAIFNANYLNFTAPSSPFGTSGNGVQCSYGPNGDPGGVTGNLQLVTSLTYYNKAGAVRVRGGVCECFTS